MTQQVERKCCALCVGVVLSLVLMGLQNLQAQNPIKPQEAIWWGDLLTIPNVDTAKVEWLEQNADWQTATQVFSLIDQLSNTSSIQLLPAYYYSDASFYYMKDQPSVFKELENTVEDLKERPPASDAVYVHTAYAVLRSRHIIENYYASKKGFQVAFTGSTFPSDMLESSVTASNATIDITLQTKSAEELLDYLITGAGNLERAEKLVRSKPFHELIRHRLHYQYPIGASHELMVNTLSEASSDQELSQLYRLANPYGYFHFAEVRNNADKYEDLLADIKMQKAQMESYLEQLILPYVIQGEDLKQQIHLMFGDGAASWRTKTYSAIDIEYFKDDYSRLIRALGYETVHLMHGQFQQHSQAYDILARMEEVGASSLMQEFIRALDVIYKEGTASFIAPPENLTDTEQEIRAKQGAKRLDSMARLYFETLNEEDLNKQKVQSVEAKMREIRLSVLREKQTFYWLGQAMAHAIVEKGGKAALSQLMREDAMVFFDAYRQAVSDHKGFLSNRVWQLLTDTSTKLNMAR